MLTDFDSAKTAQIMRNKHTANNHIVAKRNMQQNLVTQLVHYPNRNSQNLRIQLYLKLSQLK
jgi:hypothetical protein